MKKIRMLIADGNWWMFDKYLIFDAVSDIRKYNFKAKPLSEMEIIISSTCLVHGALTA